MNEALRLLEVELRRLAPTISAALRPGMDADRVRAVLGPLPQPVPPELVELYAWHDGAADVVSGSRAQLFPGGGWLPLADAMKVWIDAMEVNGREDRIVWDSRWLPITSDGRDEYHVVECGVGQGRVVGLHYVDLPQGWWPEHTGLLDMVRALTHRWAAGAYWESGAVVDYDQRRLAALLRAEDREPPDVDQIVRDLATGPEPDFRRALRRLGTRLYPEAVPALIAVLEDPGNTRHFYAIELLGAIGDAAAIPALQAAAEHDAEVHVRQYAQRVMRELGTL
jgi:hypothetical protein